MNPLALGRAKPVGWLDAVTRYDDRVHAVVIAGIVVIYCGLVFYNLDGLTLWNDEGLSFYAAVGGVRETLANISHDTHPPLYYLLLSVWMQLGHSLFAIRSLSAVAAVFALPFVYLAARALTNRSTATLAMLLFAIAPANVMWAQKARPYSLQTMLVAIALWAFVRILLSPGKGRHLIGSGIAAALRGRRGPALALDCDWLVYAVAGGLAMLAQHPAGFFVLGCNVAMAPLIFSDLSRNRLLLINWTIAQLLLIGVWLIWLPEFIGQVQEHLLPNRVAVLHPGWMITSIWPMFADLLGVAHFWRLQPLPELLYLAVVGVGLWAAIRNRSDVIWIYLLAVSPILAGLLGYFLIHPLFGHAIFALHWFTVPYSILVAYGIASIRMRSARIAILVILMAINLKGLSNYYEESTDRLDKIAQLIAADAKPGDGIVFSHSDAGRFGVAYYLPPEWKMMPGLDTSIPGDGIIQNVASAAKNPRNWVVVPDDDTPAITFDEMAGIGDLAIDQRFGHFIVRRYDRRN